MASTDSSYPSSSLPSFKGSFDDSTVHTLSRTFPPTFKSVQELSLKLATGLSLAVHVLGPILLGLVVALVLFLLSLLFHLNWWDWFKPKETAQDVEFTLVQDTHAKRPDKAKFLAEFNQQAGGKTDPKKEISPVEKPAASAPQQVQPTARPQNTPPSPPKPAIKPVAQSNPAPPVPKPPQPMPPAKQPSAKSPELAALPTPSILLPKVQGLKGPLLPKNSSQSGPIASSASNQTTPGPVSLPSPGSLAQRSPGSTSRLGSVGNTSGNPEAGVGKIPGISAQETDFGPYMAELKRRLTRNWHPPRGDASKRVVLKFDIGRDGRLLNVEINRTSGEPLADEAALNALKLSAPFRELPPDYTGESVPVLFTFDYTVYGASPKPERVNR